MSRAESLFTLRVAGAPELRVVRFSGHEGLSSLFEFHLELAGPVLDPAQLVDQPALLRIEGMGGPRFISGVFAEVEYIGQTSSLQLYEAVLVPWLARLHLRQNCRIFPGKTTRQILEQVFIEAGLPEDRFRWDLAETYAPRDHCVQYHESDFNFISRLMEEDGLFYFFEHHEGGPKGSEGGDKNRQGSHVLVIADSAAAHPPISGSPQLRFAGANGLMVADCEHVQSFRVGERTRPGKMTVRDHNLHHPETQMEGGEAGKSHPELEVYHYPGGFQEPGLGGPHRGQTMAKLRLEAMQGDRRSAAGSSDCPRLTAGHVMALVGHPRHALDTKYRLMYVNHAGRQPQVLAEAAAGESSYSNDFGVTELKQPWRPQLRTPQPRMRGLQTATVVGPPGEEVHTDEHGRVKVQFHWDRRDAYDDSASCWVRVSQAWAGNGWGAMFLPRVGHEVLIDFIEGDPDRPMVTGRIYHGNNATPYPLPEQKTKSTIRSESSPDGGGFNELRFEDLKGSEEVFIHAQRDLNEVVLNNNSRSVTVDQSFSVGGNQSFTITKNRSVTVTEGDESLTVAQGKSTTTVQKDRSVTVQAGNSSHSVQAGTHSVTAKQAISHTSQAAGVSVTAKTAIALTAETANMSVTAKTSLSLSAQTSTLSAVAQQGVTVTSELATLAMSGQAAVSLVSREATLSLSAKLPATLSSAESVTVAAPKGVLVQGGTQVTVSAEKVLITATAEIMLAVGTSVLTLSPTGITISAPKIASTAIGMHEISGSLIKIN